MMLLSVMGLSACTGSKKEAKVADESETTKEETIVYFYDSFFKYFRQLFRKSSTFIWCLSNQLHHVSIHIIFHSPKYLSLRITVTLQ